MVNSKLVLAMVLLVALFAVESEARRGGRGGGRRPPWHRRETCEWCFTDEKCFSGAGDEPSLSEGCAECIAQQCDEEIQDNPIESLFAADCISEAWQGDCSGLCEPWEFDDRTEECKECLETCFKYIKPYQDFCPSEESQSWFSDSDEHEEPCDSCISELNCPDLEEIEEELSEFCIDYIYISCKEGGFTDECILNNLENSCSQCTPSDGFIERLINCTSCLDECFNEGQCIQNCSENKYPVELSCKFCSFMCSLQGRRKRGDFRTCTNPDAECLDCATCDTCVEGCESGRFAFPNQCRCLENPYYGESPFERVGLSKFFHLESRFCHGKYDYDEDEDEK